MSRHAGMSVRRLFADSGYDAEWLHRFCREGHGIESWIPPVLHRADGRVGGRWRSESAEHLPPDYSQRSGVESVVSGLKRRLGSLTAAHLPDMHLREAPLKALVWSIRR